MSGVRRGAQRLAVVLAATLAAGTIAGAGRADLVSSVLTGSGTATVDGVIGASEWQGAAAIDFNANVPASDGGGTAPARMLVMNDAANLYLAIRVSRSSFGLAADASWIFDGDHDGRLQNGDDQLGVDLLRFSGIRYTDGYRWACPNAPPSAVEVFCGTVFDTDQLPGSPAPGTIDGAGTGREGDGAVTFEVSHPLDSSDNVHDFSLAPGKIVGMSPFLRLWSATCNGPGCYGDTTLPRQHVGIGPPADATVAANQPRARLRTGATATLSFTLRNSSPAAAAESVHIEVALSRVVRLSSIAVAGGTCDRAASSCDVKAVPAGGSAPVTVRVKGARAGSGIVRASLFTASLDKSTADDEATMSVVVLKRRR